MKLLLSNISKSFGSTDVLTSFNLKTSHYGIIFLYGKNGCGKSTLCRILGGITTPDEGETDLPASSISAPYIKPFSELTGSENIKFCKNISNEKVTELTECFGLGGYLDKYCSEYSSGTLQKLKLVIALSSKNKMIILDEPLSHLDNESSEMLKKIIVRESKSRLIFIADTHVYKKIIFTQKINVNAKH